MGKIKVNTRELKEFERKLKSLQNPDAFAQACAKELAARLLRKVIKRTPVGQYPAETGKKGGTLRRGWTNGKSSSAAAYADSLKVQHVGNNYVVEIINPVEYASYVEFGHRTRNHKGWVPGQFMMTISEQELQEIAPKVLEKKIQKYMEGLTK
jgi:phage gpG-like protein